LLSAAERLSALGSLPNHCAQQLHGVEVHPESARAAQALLEARGCGGRIESADFLSLEPVPRYDAVIGNPPYVRYQDFSGEARARGRAAARRAGVRLSRLASSWAAFTVQASLFLKPGGRLGLVLPAELLTVSYAAEVRRFLMRRFGRVRLVLFTERVFPGVQEEIVLLMAEGDGPTDHCEVLEVPDVAALKFNGHIARRWRPSDAGQKWTTCLLPAAAQETYARLAASEAFTELRRWGDTTLGMVTGNNRFFALSPLQAARFGLTDTDLVPLSPPGSHHLRSLTFTAADWRTLGEAGRQTLLFRPAEQPSAAALRYIVAGETKGVPKAYKCRVRSPWWRVPLLPPADVLVTYMNADTPRLCANEAGVTHLNSVHGLYLRPELREYGMRFLPLAALNSLTLLAAELVGRAYGGGLLKLEPREADVLPVPSPNTIAGVAAALDDRRGEVLAHLRASRLLAAVRLIDEVFLVGLLGLSWSEVERLSEARADLLARRVARGSKPKGQPL
jgi:hypothetical protein